MTARSRRQVACPNFSASKILAHTSLQPVKAVHAVTLRMHAARNHFSPLCMLLLVHHNDASDHRGLPRSNCHQCTPRPLRLQSNALCSHTCVVQQKLSEWYAIACVHVCGTALKQSRLAPLSVDSEEHTLFQEDAILEMVEAGMHYEKLLNRKQQQSCVRVTAQAERESGGRKRKTNRLR